MKAQLERGKYTMGCLCIDEIGPGAVSAAGPRRFSGLSGIETRWPDCSAGPGLWDRLQQALHGLRSDWGSAAVLGRGTGCAAALALAEQLPVERLVLIDPVLSLCGPDNRRGKVGAAGLTAAARRQLRRLAAYARANLPLVVSDVLIVGHGDAGRNRSFCDRRQLGHCRVSRLCLRGEPGDQMYTIREISVKQALSYFLQAGELPKPLAENPELCIIDG